MQIHKRRTSVKTLVLAEKPSVGKEIARVLGCGNRQKSYCEGKEYIVTWAMGHLVELAEPASYDEKYKSWKLEHLPMMPDRMKLRIIKRSSGQFRQITRFLKQKDLKEVIIATDAGREGELVARWILRLGGWKGSVRRLWISSQTDKAIREGFKNLKPGKDYLNLSRAAESRAEADWLIGLNISRALSCKHDTRLTAGRVQTPTLALVMEREKQIRKFKPKPFWQIEATYKGFQALWNDEKGQNRIGNEEEAREILEKLSGNKHRLISVKRKEQKEAPPLAYDLTELQREANRQMGFSAQKTLQVLQKLYERHKIVTYPRTDSRYITSDMKETLSDRLRALEATPRGAAALALAAGELNPGKRFINNAGVTDHHAIIPTEEKVKLELLNTEEKMLWDLIARRFLAVLSAPALSESISLKIECSGHSFRAKGRRSISRGWKEQDQLPRKEGEENEQLFGKGLPQEGEPLELKGIRIKKGMTTPPSRHSEGSLLSAMENPGALVHDREKKETLIREGGLGTPATRAEIIEKLINHYYMERQGKELVPTSRGEELLDLVPEMLRSPELTADWEKKLSLIADGKLDSRVFGKEIRKHTRTLVDEIKSSDKKYTPGESGGTPCPFCGRPMITTRGKKGALIQACLALSCGYEESNRKGDNGSRKPGHKERALNRKLINQYSDQSKDTVTLGDMIRISRDRRKKK